MKLKRQLLIIIMIKILLLQNKLTLENCVARLKQVNLVNKTDFDDKLKILNRKITWNKTKYVLVKNEFIKLETFDSSLFIGQSYFSNDGVQLYLIFQPIYKTITTFSSLKDTFSEWESKELSNEKFTCPCIANVSVSPKRVWMNNTKIRLKFKGSCLKQEDTAPFTPNNVVNLFIVYELDSWSSDLDTDFSLVGCLEICNYKYWSR